MNSVIHVYNLTLIHVRLIDVGKFDKSLKCQNTFHVEIKEKVNVLMKDNVYYLISPVTISLELKLLLRKTVRSTVQTSVTPGTLDVFKVRLWDK